MQTDTSPRQQAKDAARQKLAQAMKLIEEARQELAMHKQTDNMRDMLSAAWVKCLSAKECI